MRWSRFMFVLVSSLLVGAAGCGSSGSTDELVLTFVGFSGENITQPDAVSGASAQVDVCQDICGGTQGSLMAEPFSETFVDALFVNQGGTDIRLDSYTVSVPGSGLPDETRQASTNIPGGRCESNSQQRCALDRDCGLSGLCLRQETTVELLLFDLDAEDGRRRRPVPVRQEHRGVHRRLRHSPHLSGLRDLRGPRRADQQPGEHRRRLFGDVQQLQQLSVVGTKTKRERTELP